MEIGTLLDPVDPEDPVESVNPLNPRRVETVARFLAGFGFPARHSYEKLTAAQRKTAMAAAEAALTVLMNHTD